MGVASFTCLGVRISLVSPLNLTVILLPSSAGIPELLVHELCYRCIRWYRVPHDCLFSTFLSVVVFL